MLPESFLPYKQRVGWVFFFVRFGWLGLGVLFVCLLFVFIF